MPDLVLKVDVDTHRGMKDGVPRVAEILGEMGVKASFFVSFGPDRSGLAVLQLFRPSFLWKMLRTNAPGLYGWKTALYGTLLPAPMIGTAFPEIVRGLMKDGHETACHAWDHRLWQDWLPLMREQSIDEWFMKMVNGYGEVVGSPPKAFGAPSWVMDKRALRIAASCNFSYLSCTRAGSPFIFAENNMLEIPSNMPCIEEVGVEGVHSALREKTDSPVPQILPVHAEVEGIMYTKEFREILNTSINLGYRILRLDELASRINRESLPVRSLRMGRIPGRAFKCAI
jgi:undecaprenyl phosphate-alpha-L-ara4FN deformylase